MFGALIVIGSCKLAFITTHFKFMTTMIGRGVFNLFVASMCLVGEDTGLFSYAMLLCLVVCGLFYILIGCACLKGYSEEVEKTDAAGAKATSAAAAVAVNPSAQKLAKAVVSGDQRV